MIRRPPRSTLDRSSAASDVYKRQLVQSRVDTVRREQQTQDPARYSLLVVQRREALQPVSYTHLRAHETVLDLVCRLLLEKQNTTQEQTTVDKKDTKVDIIDISNTT